MSFARTDAGPAARCDGCRFDGTGHLATVDGSLSVDDPAPWVERWPSLAEDWLARLDGTPAEPLREDVLAALDGAVERGLFDGLDPVLVHGDAGPAHVRFLGDDPGFLDWEGAAAMPAEYDLARLRLDWTDLPHAVAARERYADVLDGYREVRSLPPAVAERCHLHRAVLTAKFVPGGVRAAESGAINADPGTFRASLHDHVRRQLHEV